jgi:ParB family chromosome partitioning protein
MNASLKNKGLGKGLSAIFSSTSRVTAPLQRSVAEIEESVAREEVRYVPVSKIRPNRYQPRREFKSAELEELADSIKKHGILQPLLLTQETADTYELIAGERRWRAAQLAGLTEVPAIIKTASDLEKLELALIENIQRQDLNPIEKAMSYKQLIDSFALTQEEASKRLGLSRSALANTLRLLNLPDAMQKAIADGELNEGQARALLTLESLPDQRQALFEQLIQYKLPVRQVEEAAKKIKAGKPLKMLPDFNVQARIDELQQLLQTKVDIQWSGKKGKITIDIFELDEVDALIKKLR